MEFKDGYLYHLKDDYFKLINDKFLMKNKTGKRPSYLVIKEENTGILWFIPLSTKVEKYKKIREHKLKKYGRCTTILIVKIFNKEQVILIQNAFPTIEKYVDTYHKIDGIPVKIRGYLKHKILTNFINTYNTHLEGINIFYSDVDKFRALMLKELEQEEIKN